jgi:hypothetical protein
LTSRSRSFINRRNLFEIGYDNKKSLGDSKEVQSSNEIRGKNKKNVYGFFKNKIKDE